MNNHTIHVNIGGIAFTLDTEAYRLIKDYLVRIELSYRDNPDAAEILTDIEARISELILNEQSSDVVVPTERIQEIIHQLGMPEGVDCPPGATNSTASDPTNSTATVARRLYRNPERAVLGGVCNGLATFFNIEPVWVRLAFCAPLPILILISVIPYVDELCRFFGVLLAVSVLLYLILWFSIPKARTPRQRLEMTGHKITVSSIHQNFHEDLNQINPSPKNNRTASILTELLYVLGRFVLFLIKAGALLIGFVLGLAVIGIIIGSIGALSMGTVPWHITTPFTMPGMSLVVILLALIASIPLMILIYLLLWIVFRFAVNRILLWIMFGLWILSVIVLGAHVWSHHEVFGNMHHITEWFDDLTEDDAQAIPPPVIQSDTLRVETQSQCDSTVVDTVRIEYYNQ